MKYAVYTRLSQANGEIIEIMVFNIEAHSAAAAEHRLLDGFTVVTNATAYSMETDMAYAAPYISASKCMDIRDFTTRCNAMMAHRQENIDSYLDDIEETREDLRKVGREITELEEKLRHKRSEYENIKIYLDDITAECKAYCKAAEMPMEHSAVKGIA